MQRSGGFHKKMYLGMEWRFNAISNSVFSKVGISCGDKNPTPCTTILQCILVHPRCLDPLLKQARSLLYEPHSERITNSFCMRRRHVARLSRLFFCTTIWSSSQLFCNLRLRVTSNLIGYVRVCHEDYKYLCLLYFFLCFDVVSHRQWAARCVSELYFALISIGFTWTYFAIQQEEKTWSHTQ